MALLQSCLLQGASPFVVALRAEGSVRKTSSVQVDAKPACSSSICRASAGSNGNAHALPQEDCSPSPLVHPILPFLLRYSSMFRMSSGLVFFTRIKHLFVS